MDNKDLCEQTKINLIAAAIALQQCTKTAAGVIPLPGTDRVVAFGTPAEVSRLLADTTAAPLSAEQLDKLEDEQYQEILRPVLSRLGMRRYLNADPIELNPSDYRDIIDRAVAFGRANAAADRAQRQAPAVEVPSIDTPEFQALAGAWCGASQSCDQWTRTVGAKQAWADLIAHIDAKLRAGSTKDTCAEMRRLCSNCGGTGEVHRADGQYVGTCDCMFQTIAAAPAAPASQTEPVAAQGDAVDEYVLMPRLAPQEVLEAIEDAVKAECSIEHDSCLGSNLHFGDPEKVWNAALDAMSSPTRKEGA